MTIKYLLITFLLSFTYGIVNASDHSVYVDRNGIMRYNDSKKEVAFFGVNYTVPFSTAYKTLDELGIDKKAAIDKDVYHFYRLGLNAYRIHIWDIEISDPKGNLVENEHLDLLDYIIAKLKERGIKTVITTMTHYETENLTKEESGFSAYMTKGEAHTDRKNFGIQANYIYNLATRVNPYTSLCYKDDPDIVGWEIDNEPYHNGTAGDIKEYIKVMMEAFKKAGNKKPVFYNVTHNLDRTGAYYETPIDGTTYQWYPTGLIAGFERKGNILPFVDDYNIPFDTIRGFNKKAKLVYEFDVPDVLGSYIYPAITRSFRAKGFQWVTMFQYDAMDAASVNMENQTHFLNLAYTPDKAISMKISAEVMKETPLNEVFNSYPKDTVFGPFRLSYKKNLSEMNTAGKFMYTNTTDTNPVRPFDLMEIAGRGNSPVIKFEGTGAYFLDRLEDGVWRLEVMPDVLLTKDPFEKHPSIKREVGTIMWNTWPMEISLPSLGENFSVSGINKGNMMKDKAQGKSIHISPGVYILTRADYKAQKTWNASTDWGKMRLGEYEAPRQRTHTYQMVHIPPKRMLDNLPVVLTASIAGPSLPDSLVVYTYQDAEFSFIDKRFPMSRKQGLEYSVRISEKELTGDSFDYIISVYKDGKAYTLPANTNIRPDCREYYSQEHWSVPIVGNENQIQLITIPDDNNNIEVRGMPNKFTSSISCHRAKTLMTEAPRLKIDMDPMPETASYFIRKYIKSDIEPFGSKLQTVNYLCVNLRNVKGLNNLKIGFITNMGYTYSAIIQLSDRETYYRIPISQLEQTPTALLPEAYPEFMKRYFTPVVNIPFRSEDIEILEISAASIPSENGRLELGTVWLE